MEQGQDIEAKDRGAVPVNRKRSWRWAWFLVVAIVAGGAVGAFAYRTTILDWITGKQKTETVAPVTTDQTSTTNNSISNTTTSTKIVDEGITWLSPREKLADLGLFKAVPDSGGYSGYVDTTYYKVATTTSGEEVVLAVVKLEELTYACDFHHFLKKSGAYYWLSENSDSINSTYTRINSQTDATFVIKSLQLDKTITKGSTVLTMDTNVSRRETFVIQDVSGTKIKETKWGDLSLLTGDNLSVSAGSVKVSKYYIHRNDGINIIYTPNPSFKNDDGTFNLTWGNQAGADIKFSPIMTSGCGGGTGSFPYVSDESVLAGKTEIGVSSTGSKIYSVPLDSALMEAGYRIYLMDGLTDKASKADFAKNLGIVVWQDDFGNYIAYMNNGYAPQVECGKPVIYLYPEKDTAVFVKVGANITKSEPEYGDGFRVFAKKGGELSIGQKVYPYLFWEGTGFGEYPSITVGTVVETPKVAETIASQLREQGLNKKEIADFNEFWLPKMPNTPFVRLSWLTTEEMNRLAPLKITPKPESVLRVFLDFEGLNQKINIAPQTFQKFDRNGFTVVEWGGLLVSSR